MIKDPQPLASNKHDRGFDLEATEKQIQLAVIAGLEPRILKMQNRCTGYNRQREVPACLFFGFDLYLLIFINCNVCGAITPSHHTTAFSPLTVGYSPQTESYVQSNLP